jgi:arylsulfatase A-like enzyme
MVAKQYGVRTETHKLVYYYETDEWELFDLQWDPNELQNIYDDPENAQLVAELKTELKRLRRFYGDDTGEDFEL